MASTPKDTERLELRLEKSLMALLKLAAKKEKTGNVQELIRRILTDYTTGSQPKAVTETASMSPDFATLLIEAHKANAEANRTIAEQAKAITALTAKKEPAEPAVFAEATPSTVELEPSELPTPEQFARALKRMSPRGVEKVMAALREAKAVALSR